MEGEPVVMDSDIAIGGGSDVSYEDIGSRTEPDSDPHGGDDVGAGHAFQDTTPALLLPAQGRKMNCRFTDETFTVVCHGSFNKEYGAFCVEPIGDTSWLDASTFFTKFGAVYSEAVGDNFGLFPMVFADRRNLLTTTRHWPWWVSVNGAGTTAMVVGYYYFPTKAAERVRWVYDNLVVFLWVWVISPLAKRAVAKDYRFSPASLVAKQAAWAMYQVDPWTPAMVSGAVLLSSTVGCALGGIIMRLYPRQSPLIHMLREHYGAKKEIAKRIKEHECELKGMRQQLESVTCDKQKLEKNKEELAADNNRMMAEIDTLNNKLADVSSKSYIQALDVKKLDRQKTRLNAELIKTQGDKEDVEGRLRQHEAKYGEVNANLAVTSKRLKRSEDELSTARTLANGKQASLDRTNETLHHLSGDITKFQGQLDDKKQRVEEQARKISDLEEELRAAKKETSEKTRSEMSLNAKLQRIERDKDQFEGDVCRITKQLEDTKDKLETAEADLDKSNAETSDSKNELAESQRESVYLSQQLSEKEKQLQEKESERSELKAHLAKKKSEHKELEEKARSLESELNRCKSQYSELDERQTKLESDLSSKAAELQDCEVENRRLKREKEALRTEFDAAERRLMTDALSMERASSDKDKTLAAWVRECNSLKKQAANKAQLKSAAWCWPLVLLLVHVFGFAGQWCFWVRTKSAATAASPLAWSTDSTATLNAASTASTPSTDPWATGTLEQEWRTVSDHFGRTERASK